MLEGLAAWVLNTYVGEYLENLNTDQLSIGLLQGEVELENLPLKKDALKYLGLPVEVKAGFVGKIRLQIPVYRLRSEPWVISIEKLYLVAGPLVNEKYDEEKEEQIRQESKLSQLDALENKWKVENEAKKESSYYANSYSSWLSYGTSFVSNIIENIQLKIKDVHLRYEDCHSIPNTVFAAGILINNFSAQSTDGSWEPKYVLRDSTDIMRKLMELDNLAVYWDTSATILGNLDGPEFTASMQRHTQTCVTTKGWVTAHEFLLAHVCAKAHVQRNCSPQPLRQKMVPRIICDLHLEKIPLTLTELQYKQMVDWMREFRHLDTVLKFKKWKPLEIVHKNPKAWWNFVIMTHLEEIQKLNKRRTWKFAENRAKIIVDYVEIYKCHLTKPEGLTPSMKASKDNYERELDFDELCILRQLVFDQLEEETKKTSKTSMTKAERGRGVLQHWFPGWSGWYSSSVNEASTEEASTESPSRSDDEDLRSHLEGEIFDVLDTVENDTLLKRDTVFARLNFSLQTGSFILVGCPKKDLSRNSPQVLDDSSSTEGGLKVRPFIELEFSDVKTILETRPRNGSYLFEIKLGALFLKDKVITNPIFPNIVFPQSKEISVSYAKSVSYGISFAARPSLIKTTAPNPFNLLLDSGLTRMDHDEPLFELVYEYKPFNSKSDHRLVIETKSLDMIYNPLALKALVEFFSLSNFRDTEKEISLLSNAARTHYENIKQQTKRDLKLKLDKILEGEDKFPEAVRWQISLDISAPQIIIPDNLQDKNATVVIFDLGRLRFSSSSPTIKSKEKQNEDIDDSDEDEFKTPCSTPVNEEEESEMSSYATNLSNSVPVDSQTGDSSSTEISIRERLYEKYTMELCDMQVLVGRAKDNWKFAQLRGTSTMHILDRFSISVYLERRLIYSLDPLWPAITISGNLPKMVLHVNEQKVQALLTCADIVSAPISRVSQRKISGVLVSENPVLDADQKEPDNGPSPDSDSNDSKKEVSAVSVLILTQFCVDQMSFEVQSRARSIAELQVTGVKATLTKKPFETSVTLCVHSLLLVDAIQTYGPDFELLIASHKRVRLSIEPGNRNHSHNLTENKPIFNISMDSMSGSIKDSEPNSPTSPASPSFPVSPPTNVVDPASSTALHAALNSLQNESRKGLSHRHITLETLDNDALISVEFTIVHGKLDMPETLKLISVQFNNLDVIANQETIVELVNFIRRIGDLKGKQTLLSPITPEENVVIQNTLNQEAKLLDELQTRTELTFDFHRLNILLLKATSKKRSSTGLKIATATLSGAKIQASLGESIEINGALGGLQVIDLITENTNHQRILSVGHDPLADKQTDLISRLQSEVYKSFESTSSGAREKALTFNVKHQKNKENMKEIVIVNIRMASVCYTHLPKPLSELASCAAEVKHYVSSLAKSIKSAATEVAKGIVGRWPDVGGILYETSFDLDEGVLKSDSLNLTREKSVDVRLDILLQTPVIVLPTSPHNPDVLVAHLGRISVQNVNSGAMQSQEFSLLSCDPYRADTLFVEVRDMNLHSLNVEENIKKHCNDEVGGNLSLLPIQELYCCTQYGIPILHDTVIECSVDKIVSFNQPFSPVTGETLYEAFDENALSGKESHLLQIKGQVVTPLKISLIKQQYEQVLKILDNLTVSEKSIEKVDSQKDISTLDILMEEEKESLMEDPVKTTFINLPKSPEITYMVSIKTIFSIPEFTIQLSSDLGEREQGLVKLSFQNFTLDYTKKEEYETSFQVTLHGLIMEDLIEPLTSKHRLLMASVLRETPPPLNFKSEFKSEYLSNSCPNMSDHQSVLVLSHLSLPDNLNTQNMFQLQQSRIKRYFNTSHNTGGRQQKKTPGTGSYPSTPPPSPTGDREGSARRRPSGTSSNALVNINVLIVDPASPNFKDKYKSTQKFIEVDFNCLETTINLQTWVMVLDFFGIGADPVPASNSSAQEDSKFDRSASMDTIPEEFNHVNSEIELNVSSLTLILNKRDYELAKANISKFSSHLSFRDMNTSIEGRIGSMSLSDLTFPNGLYKERFRTTGKEALQFNIFKYGLADPELRRDCDIRVKCSLQSVQYIHTQRFQTETLAFIQYFSQLQDFMARIRAAASGNLLNATISRGSRILLDINAGSPVIVIPHSHESSNVLVAVLGKLTVRNKFLYAGSPDTISKVSRVISPDMSFCESELDGKQSVMSQSLYGSFDFDVRSQEFEPTNSNFMIDKYFEKHVQTPDHVCLLDVMFVELSNMDLYSACRIAKNDDDCKESQIEGIEFPSFIIQREGGKLLKEKFMFRVQVERNLDSEMSHSVPDMTMQGMVSSVHFVIDQSQLKLVLGILNYNLGEGTDQFTETAGKMEEPVFQAIRAGRCWTCMSINLDLVNVTVELVNSHNRVDCANSGSPLAKFDFIKSRLSYESFSDQARDIDLVSHQIRVLDTRYQSDPVNTRPNVFTHILQPSKNDDESSLLQVEVHYRRTKDLMRLTVLLNNMRVMGVFDWLKKVYDFIMVSPDEPPGFKSSQMPSNKSYYGSFQSSPQENFVKQPSFEIKINVTDTELVIVEDPALWDTNAVILKATAVLSFRSGLTEKPLSCSLQSLEVFSAILGIEDETALSIIDPVTVHVEITGKSSNLSRGLLSTENIVHTLEISMPNTNLRLSYHDITMFLQIFESFKKQTGFTFDKRYDTYSVEEDPYAEYSVHITDNLLSLGFKKEDCLRALQASGGKLDDAAIWLTKNATIADERISPQAITPFTYVEEEKKGVNLQAVEVKIECGSLCVIDDCDADVPLVEITLSNLYIHQKLCGTEKASTSFIISVDYFNRSISGWEPFIEPWSCSVNWEKNIQNMSQLLLNLEAIDTLNINISRTLLELYSTVKMNWIEDYYKFGVKSQELQASSGHHRNRQPFVPFALKNETGCKLWFSSVTTSSEKQESRSSNRSSSSESESLSWTEVANNATVPFSFEGTGKIRHRKSQEIKIHQLLVRVDGWQQVSPVSLNRVGVYFRHAKPQLKRSASVYVEVPPARVVFDVSLEGSAKKLVTVRSALLFKNNLRETMELHLKNSTHFAGVSQTIYLVPNSTLPIPLNCVYSHIWAKPCDHYVALSTNNINWQQVSKPNEIIGSTLTCLPTNSAATPYNFCVMVKRENYPSDVSLTSGQLFANPGHKIRFIPPLEIINLLPYELHFYLRDPEIKSYIKPGKSVHLHNVDIREQLVFRFTLESFCNSADLIINRSSHDFSIKLEMYDTEDRLLTLSAKVLVLQGGAMKMSIRASFWMVNRTGLPLVFKQEGTQGEAAGQFREHEAARSVTPLLFSLSDNEASVMCNMRVGKSLHHDGAPQWCSRFHLEQGMSVRRLRVTPLDSRPDWVYMIGIDVKPGNGQYRDTQIVTLSPRFYLSNKSEHKLELAQKFATKQRDPSKSMNIMSAMPNCSLPFHWPRVDLDNLLCVRMMDIPDCHWSGGFEIERISSFHINMRDGQGQSQFLRVETLLQGATFFIIFTDADKMPPPFRIDNLSEVSVTYYQTNIREERLESLVKPHTSVPYAFDEPSLPPLITVSAPGGSTDTYNMDVFAEGNPLYYENFIYIAFDATFQKNFSNSSGMDDICARELVLDVLQSRVFLNRKEPGKRSQLWRMTSTGMIQHEGSSPPRDLRKPHVDNGETRYLDIAELGLRPGEYAPLRLRKYDERRSFTQTWKFTEDGRLCCKHPNLYVQAKDGFAGIKAGNDVVLGPPQHVCYATMENGIPFEQAISSQKLRKGSGMLSVKVINDGPTRVLQISDKIKRKESVNKSISDWVVVDKKKFSPTEEMPSTSSVKSVRSLPSSNDLENENIKRKLVVLLNLTGGLGVSVINHYGEELIYGLLRNIMIEYSTSSAGDTFQVSVQNVQIDNQLRDSERSAVLYLTPLSETNNIRFLPALCITVQRLPTPQKNAQIFKHLIVTVRNVTLLMEEKLMLKLVEFLRLQENLETEVFDEQNMLTSKSLSISCPQGQRYYFSMLRLSLPQVRLSCVTASLLPVELQRIKKKMGWTLIRFEDAVVNLDSFEVYHPFETLPFIWDSIKDHYQRQLRSQAAKILGAVNFLGNPIGLMNDVSDGLTGLIYDGNVGGLIKNVAHGLSNSAAKVTGTLSDSIGMVTMDDKHQTIRNRIRQENVGSGGEHFMAGLKGLGFGLFGGVTSIVTQAYDGASNEGFPGFFSGLGKGIVGTVTKPTVGFLDFASGAASAVRDTSKRNKYAPPPRCRKPRVCVGKGGLVQRYSTQHSLGQELLYTLNNRNYNELCIAYEQLTNDLRILITSCQIYIVSLNSPSPNVTLVTTAQFSELICCQSKEVNLGDKSYYLELVMKADSMTSAALTLTGDLHSKKAKVKCESEQISQKVSQLINYAKNLYEEKKCTVSVGDETQEKDE